MNEQCFYAKLRFYTYFVAPFYLGMLINSKTAFHTIVSV